MLLEHEGQLEGPISNSGAKRMTYGTYWAAKVPKPQPQEGPNLVAALKTELEDSNKREPGLSSALRMEAERLLRVQQEEKRRAGERVQQERKAQHGLFDTLRPRGKRMEDRLARRFYHT